MRDLLTQLVHPLALVLWAAAALATAAGTPVLSAAIALVVVVNAFFAFGQERQAQRAVAALQQLLPHAATVVRDGRHREVEITTIVVGDVVAIEEGDRVAADARLLDGAVEMDMSPLTGESVPTSRMAGATTTKDEGWLRTPDLVFSGTLCTSGAALAVVFATGGGTELGRIAALSQRQHRETSPLEKQVRWVAWLIAAVGVVVGAAFMPLGLLAGLSSHDAFLFAVGLLVANVPEGLLPTITLALAAGVRSLAADGAVMKRLSAVETLGSTTVICTDKTGTLTENRMHAVDVWTPANGRQPASAPPGPQTCALAEALAGCSVVDAGVSAMDVGDATEGALYELAHTIGADVDPVTRDAHRRQVFRFSSSRRLMSAVQERPDGLVLLVKGAPESVVERCVADVGAGRPHALDARGRARVIAAADALAEDGLRVLAVANRRVDTVPTDRDVAERDLTLIGFVGLLDPARPEVAAAVAACHRAGIKIHVVTGDNGATAAHVAREVGIGGDPVQVVSGPELDRLPEPELDRLLASGTELVFARSSPEAKLRIADALRAEGHVVAMTGDGVNDAPALHRADIGVAMGKSGTDVARESATMVLTDDDFATIAVAVEEGRRVYDNVRKFILYIFAHAVPEIVPFLVFALAGGLVPLPLTVMQILAIDLGTETLPALALGRERAEPGVMDRPPRPRSERVVNRALLFRAWALLGTVSAALVMAAFFFTLWRAGWHPGDAVGDGAALHHAYLQATTATFAGIVACQVGTAFAARTDKASLRTLGVLSNRLLLWGIGFELGFTALLVWTPGVQSIFGTTGLPWQVLALIAPFPLVVWGVDEWRRARLRRRGAPS